METRNITLTLDKAKEWYNTGGALKEVALQAFSEDELKEFKRIRSFYDAMKALYPSDIIVGIGKTIQDLEKVSKASTAMFKLNIIRKALNKGHKMSFTKGEIWYPYNPLTLPGNKYSIFNNEIKVGKVKIDNQYFTLLGGCASYGGSAGLGYFISSYDVASPDSCIGFLGCATKEIAQHFGRYFGKEIFEAKYGDVIDYEWI